jgi:hypothetical protein
VKGEAVAKEQALTIDQGSRFQYVVAVTGMSLTGLTAKMQIRSGKGSSKPLILDVTSYCTIDSGAGQIIIDIPGSVTDGADWIKGQYDLKVYNAGNSSVSPVRIMQGFITLDEKVTV